MKDLSFFLLKNSIAAKMKKGLRNFCNGVGSTSTLNQRKTDHDVSCMVTASPITSYFEEDNLEESPLTLEEMILQLELEEEAARAARLDEYGEFRRRMSCVNNSDILRSARNALNQYPRFSLDGKDAMYRSSFRSFVPPTSSYETGRKSVCCPAGLRGKFCSDGYELNIERNLGLPATLAGESVIWCKPGVVPKLMGLEAIPVPITTHGREKGRGRWMNNSEMRKQNLRKIERHELEKSMLVMGKNPCGGNGRRESMAGSSSKANYCIAKPIGRVRV